MEVNGRFITWPLYAGLPLGSGVVALQSSLERAVETQHLTPFRESNLYLPVRNLVIVLSELPRLTRQEVTDRRKLHAVVL